MEKRLEKLDLELLDWEIQTLYRDCYLRLKRLLAREWVEFPESRERVAEQIKLLEEAYKG